MLASAGPSTAPRSLSVVSFNVSTLGVTWESPDEITINGILRHYVLEYCSTLGEAQLIDFDSCVVLQTASRDTTAVTLTGLREHTTYSVAVSAFTIHAGPSASRFQNTGSCVVTILSLARSLHGCHTHSENAWCSMCFSVCATLAQRSTFRSLKPAC